MNTTVRNIVHIKTRLLDTTKQYTSYLLITTAYVKAYMNAYQTYPITRERKDHRVDSYLFLYNSS